MQRNSIGKVMCQRTFETAQIVRSEAALTSNQCVGSVGNKIGTRNVVRYAGRTDIRSSLLRSGREVKEVCSAQDSV